MNELQRDGFWQSDQMFSLLLECRVDLVVQSELFVYFLVSLETLTSKRYMSLCM